VTFEKRFTDQELMRAVSEMKPCAAKELANKFGVSKQAIFWRLERLERRGRVRRVRAPKHSKNPDLWFCYLEGDE
jgi:predicted ArsR family transcriptional regulator